MKNLKVIYMGTPAFSAKLLEALIAEGFNIVGVVTQSDAFIGRKRTLTPSPVKEVAIAHNIPVFTPERIRTDYKFILNLKPDLILTFAYGQIVPKEVLAAPKIACLNFHGSILPKYRGASPIQMALFNGDKKTGVTLMEMNEKMDAGRIFGIQEFPIMANDNFKTITIKMVTASMCLVRKVLPNVVSGENIGIAQDESAATYAPLLKRSDEFIDLKYDTTLRALGKIRAFTPGSGLSVYYLNNVLKIHAATLFSNSLENPVGRLFINEDKLLLQLKDGQISILSLQKAGKTIVDVKSFINGERHNLPTLIKGLAEK